MATPDNLGLLNLAVSELASVAILTRTGLEKVLAQLSFVLGVDGEWHGHRLGPILAADVLGVASLITLIAGHKGGSCQVTREGELLAVHGLSSRLESSHCGPEWLRHECFGRNEFFDLARYKWFGGSRGPQGLAPGSDRAR